MQMGGSGEARRVVTQGLAMQDQGSGIPHSKPSFPSRAGFSPVDGQFPLCLFSNNASVSIPKMNSKKLVSKRKMKKKKNSESDGRGLGLPACM